MAYIGGINFLALPFDEVEWVKGESSAPWSEQPRQLGEPQSSGRADRTTQQGIVQLQLLARAFATPVDYKTLPGYNLLWDADESALDTVRCVSIARHKGTESPRLQYYVLIVKKLKDLDVYERVGVGWLPKEGIDFDGERMSVTVR
jgi:hypothetical protein